MRYTAENMLIKAKQDTPHLLNSVTAQEAGWDYLNCEIRAYDKGQAWSAETGENEAALVILQGQCKVETDKASWERLGRRPSVFLGMPYAVYLPRRTRVTVTALTDGLEFAYGWVPTDQDHPIQLITPADSEIELRGGHGSSRQINSIIPPGFDCHRLVVCEVYTPQGNWSSWPPHKHDVHIEDEQGKVLEADLEEIYYFKIDKPQGFAFQRVYNDDRSIDGTMCAYDNDIVLVPEGYHPVSAAYAYNCYYLNFLAGSAQSLAATDDPAHAWIKSTWTAKDPRLPVVTHGMEI